MRGNFREWKNKTRGEKALELSIYGGIFIPVVYGVEWSLRGIGSAMGITEPSTLMEIIEDPRTYALAVGLSMGRGTYYEIGYRLKNWKEIKEAKAKVKK